MTEVIEIYTDGACREGTGAWAAILFHNNQQKNLTGIVNNTTHNRMELTAALKAIGYINKQKIKASKIIIYTDSQYLVGLPARRERLEKNNFKTRAGKPIRNMDLVVKLFELLDEFPVELKKVKAHQKKTEATNYNREVDKLVRKKLKEFGVKN